MRNNLPEILFCFFEEHILRTVQVRSTRLQTEVAYLIQSIKINGLYKQVLSIQGYHDGVDMHTELRGSRPFVAPNLVLRP